MANSSFEINGSIIANSGSFITNDYFVGKTKYSVGSISVTTSQVDNWDLSAAAAVVSVNLDSVDSITTYLSVTGIEAGEEGEIKTIYNASTTKFIQMYSSLSSGTMPNTSSLDSNRMVLGTDGSVLRLLPGGLAIFMYLNNKWRAIDLNHQSMPLSYTYTLSSFGSVGGGGV